MKETSVGVDSVQVCISIGQSRVSLKLTLNRPISLILLMSILTSTSSLNYSSSITTVMLVLIPEFKIAVLSSKG